MFQISIIEGKNPAGESAEKQNPVTMGGVDADNNIVSLALNTDGSLKLFGSSALNDEQLTVSNTVKTLTAAKYTGANKALITVTGADLRFRLLQTGDPTATLGQQLKNGESFTLTSQIDIVNFKAIRTGVTDAVIDVTYSI